MERSQNPVAKISSLVLQAAKYALVALALRPCIHLPEREFQRIVEKFR